MGFGGGGGSSTAADFRGVTVVLLRFGDVEASGKEEDWFSGSGFDGASYVGTYASHTGEEPEIDRLPGEEFAGRPDEMDDGLLRGNMVAIFQTMNLDFGAGCGKEIENVLHSAENGVLALEDLVENTRIVSGVSERLAGINEVVIRIKVDFFFVYHDGSLRAGAARQRTLDAS